MKHLLTLAFAALVAVAAVPSAQAQQAAAAKPAKPAAMAKAKPAASKWSTAQIKDAQTGLQKAKLYTGKITGVWSASTVKAYKAWQKANGMSETGELTDDALAKLKGA